MEAALVGARFVHYAALTLLFGGLLFPFYTRPRHARAAGPDEVEARLRPALTWAAWLALASALVCFVLTLAGMAGERTAALNVSLLASTATDTEFGRLWVGRMLLIAASALGLSVPRRAGARLSLACSAVALGSLAGSGHARVGEGWRGALHVAADGVHLLAAGVWIGALPCLAVLLAAGRAGDARSTHDAVGRFSAVATVSVGLLVLSGVVSTALLIGAPSELLAHAWGRLLLLKLALVAAMLGLAGVNRWRVTPRLSGHDWAQSARRLRRNAQLELGLAIAVLAIVSLLGTLAPEG